MAGTLRLRLIMAFFGRSESQRIWMTFQHGSPKKHGRPFNIYIYIFDALVKHWNLTIATGVRQSVPLREKIEKDPKINLNISLQYLYVWDGDAVIFLYLHIYIILIYMSVRIFPLTPSIIIILQWFHRFQDRRFRHFLCHSRVHSPEPWPYLLITLSMKCRGNEAIGVVMMRI